MFIYSIDININGVRRVENILKYYGDLEKNFIRYCRLLFDSVIFFKSYLVVEKLIKKERKKGLLMFFVERERNERKFRLLYLCYWE